VILGRPLPVVLGKNRGAYATSGLDGPAGPPRIHQAATVEGQSAQEQAIAHMQAAEQGRGAAYVFRRLFYRVDPA